MLDSLGPRTVARIRKSLYMPVLAGSMAIMFARLLIMAHLFDVEQFAALNMALIVSNLVSTIAGFGLFADLQRRLPVHLEFRRFRAAASHLTLATVGAVGVAVLALCCAVPIGWAFHASLALVVVGVAHGFAQQFFLIATTESRSNGEPLRYSWQNLGRAAAVMTLTVPIAWLTNSAMLTMLGEAAIALTVATAIFFSALRKFAVPLRLALVLSLRRLRSTRWPSMAALTLISLTGIATLSVDRWLAAAYLDHAAFATYAFASISMTLAYSVQALINASIYPALAKRLALYGRRAAFRLSLMSSTACLIACCIAAIPALLLANALIGRFYPQYIGATALLPILTIAAILRLSDFWASLLIIGDGERSGVLINVVVLATNMVGWYLLTRIGVPLPLSFALLTAGIALSTTILSVLWCWRFSRATS